MKRRRLILIPVGCVASITLAFLVWPQEREPEYNGVSLNKWLERDVGWTDAEFRKAIKQMDTNALPMLVRSVAVNYQMPRWRVWIGHSVAPRLPKKIADSRFIYWAAGDLALRRANGAVNAFGILGYRAAPALSKLRRSASNRPMNFTSDAIVAIMSAIPADFIEPPPNLN
jgi:hypothetical protein